MCANARVGCANFLSSLSSRGFFDSLGQCDIMQPSTPVDQILYKSLENAAD